MEKVNLFFFIAAILSLILSAVVHVLSLSGVYIEEDVPYIYVFQFVALIIFLFAFIDLRKTPQIWNEDLREDLKKSDYIKLMFNECPKLILVLLTVVFLYAQIDFLLTFLDGEGGVPSIMDGNYVLANHGEVIKQLTEKEYIDYQIKSLRSYSSLWMIFLSFTVGRLWPKREKSND